MTYSVDKRALMDIKKLQKRLKGRPGVRVLAAEKSRINNQISRLRAGIKSRTKKILSGGKKTPTPPQLRASKARTAKVAGAPRNLMTPRKPGGGFYGSKSTTTLKPKKAPVRAPKLPPPPQPVPAPPRPIASPSKAMAKRAQAAAGTTSTLRKVPTRRKPPATSGSKSQLRKVPSRRKPQKTQLHRVPSRRKSTIDRRGWNSVNK